MLFPNDRGFSIELKYHKSAFVAYVIVKIFEKIVKKSAYKSTLNRQISTFDDYYAAFDQFSF